jgi:hypothetical protein
MHVDCGGIAAFAGQPCAFIMAVALMAERHRLA